MKRTVTAFLVGANVLLLCLLAWLWIDPRGGLRDVHWQPPAAIKPDLGSLSTTSLGREEADAGRYMAILDRPLFYPGRRPAPATKGTASRTDAFDSIHLYGLFRGTEGAGVLVRVDGKTRRLKVSEALGDWSLKEIRSREVVFARGGETRVVPLVQAGQAGAAIAGAVTVPGRGPGAFPAAGTPNGAVSGPGGPTWPAVGSPGLPMPFPLPGRNAMPVAPAFSPTPAPAANKPAPTPSPGNAAAPAPSNAMPAPSPSPFVTGGSR